MPGWGTHRLPGPDGMTALHKAALCPPLPRPDGEVSDPPGTPPRAQRHPESDHVLHPDCALGQSPRPLRPHLPSTVTPLTAPKTLLGPMGTPTLPSSRLMIRLWPMVTRTLALPPGRSWQLPDTQNFSSPAGPAVHTYLYLPRSRLFLVPLFYFFGHTAQHVGLSSLTRD